MTDINIVRITDRPELREAAAAWFSEKWDIPQDEYLKSMDEALRGTEIIPQWYLALKYDTIIAGLGVIENDFHDRKDLSPNVCAVYVEEDYRRRGIAGELLKFVSMDMAAKGVDTLFLITDHDHFYERYGWEFYCMAKSEQNGQMSRMYIHNY